MKKFDRSKQAETLRDKIRERNGSTRTLEQHRLSESAMFERLLIFRPDAQPLGAVLIDLGKDGYALYLAVGGNRIDSDVDAIFSADV